jgi:hypothetical protein
MRSTNGLTTGGQTGQKVCGFVSAGFYYNSGTGSAVACPADSYAAAQRPITDPTVGSCPLWCAALRRAARLRLMQGPRAGPMERPRGQPAGGGSAGMAAAWHAPGRRLLIPHNPSRPPAPPPSSALSAGLTTNNATGSTSCAWVFPGYGSNAVNTAFLCPTGTFANTVRPIPATCTNWWGPWGAIHWEGGARARRPAPLTARTLLRLGMRRLGCPPTLPGPRSRPPLLCAAARPAPAPTAPPATRRAASSLLATSTVATL